MTIRILDFFGLPKHGGGVTLHCEWQIPLDLAERAGNDPIHLASRVRDRTGRLVVDNGPRSLPVSATRPRHEVFVPLELPATPGAYEVEIDAVVEHKFWASWHGIAPTVVRVERRANGDLTGVNPSSGRRYDVIWPETPPDRPFAIPHPLYGAADSERAVEIPWALSRYRGERCVLDVGYAYAEPRYHQALAALQIPLLVGIDLATATHPAVRGVVADVRHPPLLPGSIELIVAISVIEHIGRDNTVYPGGERFDVHESDGDFRAIAALAPLLAPGGRLLLTVPFGVAEDHGWMIQYDDRRIADLVLASGLVVAEADYFQYDGAWRGPVPPSQLAGCRYEVHAVAAAGLACLMLQRPGTQAEPRYLPGRRELPTPDEARRFLAQSPTFWWQRFEIGSGVWTPGHDHIRTLLAESAVPASLAGKSVLDVGTANGAVCFEMERRGASRVVGVDVDSGTDFGFERTRDFLGSRAAFVRASIYELPELLDEQFDLVFFYGVLYHLRHPLLALDSLYRLVRPDGSILIETAVADHQIPEVADRSAAVFYPRDELNGDPSNWFAPTVRGLIDWCESSGLSAEVLVRRPEDRPVRCVVRASRVPGPPAYERISYERPLRTVVARSEPTQPG